MMANSSSSNADNTNTKQDADKSNQNPQQDGFSAEELGRQSIYDDPTDMMRQMQRGDETKGDPNARDVAGATAFKDTEEGRTDKDTTPHARTPGSAQPE